MSLTKKISGLEQKLADFGYGEMQIIDEHSWVEIKKAIMASHKTSPYKDVTIKPMWEKFSFSSSHGGGFSQATADVTCQFDSDANPSLHSVTAKISVTLKEYGVGVEVQTRYNQA